MKTNVINVPMVKSLTVIAPTTGTRKSYIKIIYDVLFNVFYSFHYISVPSTVDPSSSSCRIRVYYNM